MASRESLHDMLIDFLGSPNVYYQAPESIKMEYDAIRYSKKNIESRYANNHAYSMMDCYELIVISRRPDNEVIKRLLTLPYCKYDRHYISNGLHHDALTLYY